jgi:hypothetical protein
MTDIVIELDESPAELPAEDPIRLRWPARPWRIVATALLAVSVLLLPAGASPQPVNLFRELTAFDDKLGRGPVAIVDGTVFRHADGILFAHSLDGTLRWESRGGEGARLVELRQHNDLIVFSENLQDDWITTAVELTSGVQRWQVKGRPNFVDGYLVFYPDTTQPFRVMREEGMRTLWSLPAGSSGGTSLDLRSVFSVDSSGTLSEHELATGRVKRSVALDFPSDPPLLRHIEVMATSIQISSSQEAPRWVDRASMRVISQPGEQFFEFRDCGAVDCRINGDGSWSIMDRRSGAELWRTIMGGAMLITPAGPAFMDSRGFELANTRTGERQTLIEWEPVIIGGDGRGLPKAEFLMRRGLDDNSMLMRLTADGPVYAGTLPPMINSCRQYHDLITCALVDRRIGVWQVRAYQ